MPALDPNVREKIVSFVRAQGPVLPVQISQTVQVDLLFAGALLSELVSKKLIKISHAKIGGSPVYYYSGQESKLENLYKYLAIKEKEAYDLLKKETILKDRDIEPSIRVALREIRDFALPIKINYNNEEILFWRWYLTPVDDLERKVKEILNIKVKGSKVKESKKVEKPVQEIVKEEVKEKKIKKVESNEFLEQINSYLTQNGISVVQNIETKNKKEVNMVIKVPSNLGELELFLCARNKKRFNDGDLSLAHNRGQSKKLPVLFLGCGELTKKAKDYLDKNLRGYLIFKTIS